MFRVLTAILAITLLPLVAAAWTVSGHVHDADTGDPLPYATIRVVGNQLSTFSSTEGLFFLKTDLEGAIPIEVSYIGYRTWRGRAKPGEEALVVELKRTPFAEDPVIVTGTRVEVSRDPVPFRNMDEETISERYWAQDPPMLVAETPGVYAWNESGHGVGNSYLSLRGFSQNRVAVMINGIPLNGADSHEVWWVDLPDFAASLKDVQVTRGVMGSLYGSTALGGSINLLTDSFERERGLKIALGAGSWGTRKASLEYNSGLLADSWTVNTRLSKLESDGYRDNSWCRSWAYYFNLSHLGEKSTLRLNIFGGPENAHLAYKGITREQLDSDRLANEMDWPDEQDHFHQPHFELHHKWQPMPGASLSNTFFLTRGDGFYEQFRTDKSAFEYNLVDSLDDDYDTDLVRKRSVGEWDAGWINQVSLTHGRHELGLGGELRLHHSKHFGEVAWADSLPGGVDTPHDYYRYEVRKRSLSAFVRDRLTLAANLSAEAVLQVQHHAVSMGDDQRYAVAFERDFAFLSPRLGLNWQPVDGQVVFAAIAGGSREPSHKEVYWATDFWSGPDAKPHNFEEDGDGLSYIGPEVKPERVLDCELGTRIESDVLSLDLTVYWMRFRDEIVPFGGMLDDNQLPNNGNAEESLHSGLELGAGAQLPLGWRLDLQAAIAHNRFIRHSEHYWTPDWSIATDILDGRIIPGHPGYIWSLRAEKRVGARNLWLAWRSIGRQYLDGSMNSERSVEPFGVLDVGLALPLGEKYVLSVRASNLLNREYESSGYIDWDDLEPRWFVGAPRNFYVGLEVDL